MLPFLVAEQLYIRPPLLVSLSVCQFVSLFVPNFPCLIDQAYNCFIHFYKKDCYDVMTYEVMTYNLMTYDVMTYDIMTYAVMIYNIMTYDI